MKRVTSFSTIEIREYNVTLGDNPGGSAGPPVSLDWDYDESITVEVDYYEQSRPPRRTRNQMHMGSSVRSYMLMRERGFSMKQIHYAAKAAATVRKQRYGTAKRIMQREELKEKVSRIFTRKS